MDNYDDLTDLKFNITKLRALSFIDSDKIQEEEKENVIIKCNTSLENIMNYPEKFQFVKGFFFVKELLEDNVDLKLLTKNINNFIKNINKFENIETLVILDLKKIQFPKGKYYIKKLICNISILSNLEDDYLISIDEKSVFPNLEILGCEEIIYGTTRSKMTKLVEKFNTMFPNLQKIYGWFLYDNEKAYSIENIQTFFSKYEFREFELNIFLPCTLIMDLYVSDSEYTPSTTSESDYEDDIF